MRPIVFISFGSMGDVFPYVEIAKNLLSFSYKIIFLAPEVYEDRIIMSVGDYDNFTFIAIGNKKSFEEDAIACENDLADSKEEKVLEIAAILLRRGEKYNQQIHNTVIRTIRKGFHKPVIVYHPFFSKVCSTLARKNELKVIEINQLFFPTDPPLLLKLLPRQLQEKFVQRMLGTKNFSLRRPFKKIALFPDWHILAGYQHIIRRERVELMGYINFKQKNHVFKTWEDSFGDSVLQFLKNRKPIVATFGSETGTSRNKHLLFSRCIEVCQNLGIPLILLCRNEKEIPAVTSPDIFMAPFIPLARLLPKASILIHHGGMGTLTTALQCLTPQILIPSGYDQFYNAKLATTKKVGESVSQDEMKKSSLALENKVKHMLQNLDQYRQSIPQSLQDEPDGALLAAEEIHRIAKSMDE